MICRCEDRDLVSILEIINDGSTAYKGIIPEDCWREPYMSREELRSEIHEGVVFWGYRQEGVLIGVMGLQFVKDAALIRHAYVRTQQRNRGVGTRLLSHLREIAGAPVLIGTWADASWAIRFYEKHGFRRVDEKEKIDLLATYWDVSRRQAEASTVLVEQG
jgi:N-acetylglutamate synthase-like GNAT family acetyltransferase